MLSTTICADWNGFIPGMWNVFEHVNLSSQELTVTTTLYSLEGLPRGKRNFRVAPGAQYDVLVHEMEGRIENSYGKVCSEHDGSEGALDGGMVFYKQSTEANYEFAFSMPMSNGKMGVQYVPFNTFHPSMRAQDQGNLVANWIQVINQEETTQAGELRFYDASGAYLGVDAIEIEPEGRVDVSAHRFGPSLVGHVAWYPESSEAFFQVRNIRYLYDNPGYVASYDTAFQVDALHGSGETLAVPLDTRSGSAILEITNTLEVESVVTVQLYSESGVERSGGEYRLSPRSTVHLITEGESFLGKGERGFALVKGSQASSIMVVAMHYERTEGKVAYMYGVPGIQALGTVMRGTYNTYLSQESELLIINPSASQAELSLSMVRSDGQVLLGASNPAAQNDITLLQGEMMSIAPRSMRIESLNQYEQADNYGVITVQPTERNTLLAWVLRRRGADYVVPRPVRQ